MAHSADSRANATGKLLSPAKRVWKIAELLVGMTRKASTSIAGAQESAGMPRFARTAVMGQSVRVALKPLCRLIARGRRIRTA